MLGVAARCCGLSTWESETRWTIWRVSSLPDNNVMACPPKLPTTTNPNQNNPRLATLFTTVFSFWPWSLLATPNFSVSYSACCSCYTILCSFLFLRGQIQRVCSGLRYSWVLLQVCLFCTCMCVYMWFHMWAHLCRDTCATYITMHLEARRVSLSGSLLSFLSQYLSPNTEVASAASPNSQPAAGPISASHLVLEIGFQAYLTFFCGCWWFELRPACLPGQHFLHWTVSLLFCVNFDRSCMGAGLGRGAELRESAIPH